MISIAIGPVIIFETLLGPILSLKEQFDRERLKKERKKEGEEEDGFSVCDCAENKSEEHRS